MLLALFLLWALGSVAFGQQDAGGSQTLTMEAPELALTGVPFDVTLHPQGSWGDAATVEAEVQVGDGAPITRTLTVRGDDGELLESVTVEDLSGAASGTGRLVVRIPGRARTASILRVLPSWLAILPPLLAIVLAIAVREVVVALVAGVWLGATFIHGYDPFTGLLRAADTYAVGALADADHASIAVFSLLLGGMIGVIARAGGAQGMAGLVTRFAKNRRSGALTTWLMGLVIFFDDYSNSLLVGTTMRPITDKLRISREKLAFLVDATAAPVSSFAIISSWVGVEVGYIADQYAALGLEGDPYLVFLETIPYRFYPILMLWFGLLLVLTKRDFGPMLKAETRATQTGELLAPGADPASDFEADVLLPPKGKKPRWINAVAPILVVITTAMVGMYTTGRTSLLEARATAEASRDTAAELVQTAPSEEATAGLVEAERALSLLDVNLRNIFGQASSLKALLWAALLGGFVAILFAVFGRMLTLREAMEAWVAGVRSITLAVMILVLAWSLGEVCQQLQTAQLVIQAIGSWLPASMLPAVVFLIAAGVSFATGTSWGTMGILFPLVVPLANELAPGDPVVVLSSVASILSGSVWGDHCSPISDTTIMSSMASSCDHVDHVRTQLPYALAVGLVSLVCGEIATGLGLYGAPVALLIGAAALFGIVRFVGRPVPEPRLEPEIEPEAEAG